MAPKKIWHKKKTVKAVPSKKGAPKKKAKSLLEVIGAQPASGVGDAERADFQSAIDDLKVEKGVLAARVVELEKWIDNARNNGIDFSSAEAVLQPVAVPVTVVVDPPKDDTPA